MFSTEFLPEALRMTVVGMGGIFIAMGIIYVASLALLKFFPEDKNKTNGNN
ncbi:OadG-related small transporter subunit [Fundicoccus culcitae]|uniref:OadG-related small transporter subunit n=1 Tax=Fundicoccus culcitae TaxID=2969821 RepID=A0ABY5P3A7_9LACT|nr:OadG-related small transporter subunit [Fundicoccus culcitae]UUX33204.1 OadG-related small transporter subunit [Fundicoccus culcitae]